MASVNPSRLRGHNYGVSEGWKSHIKQSRCSVCVWLNVLCVLKSSLEVSMFYTVLNINLMLSCGQLGYKERIEFSLVQLLRGRDEEEMVRESMGGRGNEINRKTGNK